jgi:hypothetical protein
MQRTTGFLCALAVAAASAMSLAQLAPPEPPPWTPPKPAPPGPPNEGMPPLPYPTVPGRVQQKKTPPTPPTLVVRVTSNDAEDWARTPNDLNGLLEKFRAETSAQFTFEKKPIAELATGPGAAPLIYRSGYKAFRLTEPEVLKLREYCSRGGTIVFNACMGNPAAHEAAKQASAQILPQAPLKRLSPEHPIFRSFYSIEKITYRDRMKKDAVATEDISHLEGAEIDRRIAIIVSRWDLSLGWAGDAHESWGYVDEDSRKLGVNILAYVLSTRRPGM